MQRSVVYADLEEGADMDHLVSMCVEIRKALRENGIPMIASTEFIPHLTLMKLSKGAISSKHNARSLS